MALGFILRHRYVDEADLKKKRNTKNTKFKITDFLTVITNIFFLSGPIYTRLCDDSIM